MEGVEEEQSLYSPEGENETNDEGKAMIKRILALVNTATDGKHLLDIIALLPNTAQCCGYSITMNAIIKLLCRAPSLKK
jgi:hypothetical protein